jgi:hypothetical protein
MALLPIGYASHALWLLFAMASCGIKLQPNGSLLPMKFRAVLYLDVFGWLSTDKTCSSTHQQYEKESGCDRQDESDGEEEGESTTSYEKSPRQRRIRQELRQWQSDNVQRVMDDSDKRRVASLAQRLSKVFRDSRGTSPFVKNEGPVTNCKRRDASGVVGEYTRVANGRASDLETYEDLSEDGGAGRPLLDSTGERNTKCSRLFKLRGSTDVGIETPYLYDPERGEVVEQTDGPVHSLTFIEKGVEAYEAYGLSMDRAKPLGTKDDVSIKHAPSKGSASSFALPPKREASFVDVAKSAVANVVQDFDEPTEDPREVCSPRAATKRKLQRKVSVSGQVTEAPEGVFMNPKSFAPGGAHHDEDLDEVVTGLDRAQPGRMPAKVFRSGTAMLVIIWVVGLVTPYGILQGFLPKPLLADVLLGEERGGKKHVELALGTSPDSLPELVPGYALPEELVELPKGEVISVDWPTHSGFVPRSLSCDPSGTQLVVSDDFMIFAGRLHDAGVAMSRGPLEASEGYEPGEKLAVSFEPVPPCRELEGSELKDIGIGCPDQDPSACRVLVLLAYGQHLAECPLTRATSSASAPPVGESIGESDTALLPTKKALRLAQAEINGAPTTPASPALAHVSHAPSTTWRLSSGWLHGKGPRRNEYVESLAVNSECARGRTHFHPAEMGCVVVGTTTGRLVQLRSASDNQQLLVPARTMQQLPRGFGPGTLHVLSNGVVMALSRGTGSVQAIDSRVGSRLGEWRLPKNINWLAICGGGNSLYVLGIRDQAFVELYRFPVPAEVKEAKTQQLTNSEDREWHLRMAPYEM